MEIDDGLMRQITSDLGLNVRFEKGSTIPVKNCWHFMTDGNAVDELFCDEDDFQYGMNLLYLMVYIHHVIILAFTLMDTHVHFVIYGELELCNRMVHDYVRRIAIYLSNKYDKHNLFAKDPIQYQLIDDDNYLKTVICYVHRNAPVGGLPFNAWDYPWSSAPLIFMNKINWNGSEIDKRIIEEKYSTRQLNKLFHSGYTNEDLAFLKKGITMINKIVYPGVYVAWEIVEIIFRTHRSYNYYLYRVKESDVDSRGGVTSSLTIPLQEMRQHKREMCKSLYGVETVSTLNTVQRLKLAKALKSKYNSSKKQIARVCGLVYSEVEKLL